MDEKENFLKLAKTKGFLDEAKLEKCVAEWDSIRAGGSDKKIWDVALELGFLSPRAHRRIDEHLTFIALREHDKALGAAGVEKGIVKAEDVEVALMLQRKSHKDDGKVRRLEDILVDMGALKAEEVEIFQSVLDPDAGIPLAGDGDLPPEIEPMAPLDVPGLNDLETYVGEDEEKQATDFLNEPPPDMLEPAEPPPPEEVEPMDGAPPPEEPAPAEEEPGAAGEESPGPVADPAELTLDLEGLGLVPPPEPDAGGKEEGDASQDEDESKKDEGDSSEEATEGESGEDTGSDEAS